MNKSDLIKAIAKSNGMCAADVARILDTLENVITDCMSRGETFSLRGVWSFSVRKHKARIGRNPLTGQKIQIPAQKFVKFSVGKRLREAVMAGENAED